MPCTLQGPGRSAEREQPERPLQGNLDCSRQRAIWAIEFSVQRHISGLFAKSLTLPLQEFWGIGLLQEEKNLKHWMAKVKLVVAQKHYRHVVF